MRSFMAYPAVALLVLLAMTKTGLCSNVVPCPAHCSASVTIFMQNGSFISMDGGKAVELNRVRNEISKVPWEKLVVITIANTKVEVPASLQMMIRVMVKKYPDLVPFLIKILLGEAKNQKKKTESRGPHNYVKPTATPKGTKRTTPKPTTKKVVKTTKITKKTTPKPKTKPTKRTIATKQTKKTTPKPTTKKVLKTTKITKKTTPKPTTKRTKRTTTRKLLKRTTPKPTTKKTTMKTRATTKRTIAQTTTIKPATVSTAPATSMPNPTDPKNTIEAGSGVDPKVLIMLGYMLSQPNYFAVIYRMLLQLGITFPSLTAPITQVMYGTHVIMLPRQFVVNYAYTINNRHFNLPRDSQKLAVYLSQHMDQFSIVATFLTQLGASFPVDGTGRITGFSMFSVMYRFPRAITTTILIGSRRFDLPKDISLLLIAVKHNPTKFFELQMVLEAFGVKFFKTGPGVSQAVYTDKKYDVYTGRGVSITIENTQYDIPADLEKIFQKPKGFSVGSLLAALQEKGIPINVDEKTGVILGITIDKVKIPFPVSIDLRFKLDNQIYLIPRDLAKLVTVLEMKGMPSKILSILYTRYGVLPVRDSNDIVVAVSFNGKQFKVKSEPLTAVVILGQKFMLPRDTRKMVEFVHSKQSDKTIGVTFLKALKAAGFMLINDDDGAMRSIQKGAQIIKLGIEIRIVVVYDNTPYHVPKDLMRLVKEVRSLGKEGINKVIEQLKAFDVQVKKVGSKLTILFNSVRYEVDLKSGNVKG